MLRTITLTVAALCLSASLSLADPDVLVLYPNGVPRVQLEGDYAHTTYTVYRARAADGPFVAVTNHDILCLGNCFVDDRSALVGTTYWYRFDLVLPSGQFVTFGPYPVSFSPSLVKGVGARLYPNPSNGPATLELFLAGRGGEPSLILDAALYDTQGRRVRQLFRGPLPRGLTTMPYDGLDDGGHLLEPGFYFLRYSSKLGSGVSRVVRTR